MNLEGRLLPVGRDDRRWGRSRLTFREAREGDPCFPTLVEACRVEELLGCRIEVGGEDASCKGIAYSPTAYFEVWAGGVE